MKKSLTIISLMLISTLLISCNEVKTVNTLNAAVELKYELEGASTLYAEGVQTFEESADFFEPVERRLVRSSFKKIDQAKVEIEKIFNSNARSTAIALSRFQRHYGEMRAAYSTVESVLKIKDGISPAHQTFIAAVHEQVVELDGLVSELKPSESSEIDYQAVAGIISATATLVGNVKPMIND